MKKKHLSILLRAFITLGLFIFLYFQLKNNFDISDCIDIIKSIYIVDIIGILFLAVILLLWKTYIWKYILRCTSGSVSFKYFLCSVLASSSLNLVLPSKGGDLVRFLYLKGRVEIGKCVGSLFIERVFFVISLCLISIAGTLIDMNIELFLFVISVFLFAMILLLLGFSERVTDLLKKKISGWHILKKLTVHLESFESYGTSLKLDRRYVFIYFGFCVLFWLIVMCQIYWIFQSMDIDIDIITFLAVIPAGILLSMIPISLGGVGVREVAFLELLKHTITPEQIVAFSVMFYIVRYLFPALIGVPFIALMKIRNS